MVGTITERKLQHRLFHRARPVVSVIRFGRRHSQCSELEFRLAFSSPKNCVNTSVSWTSVAILANFWLSYIIGLNQGPLPNFLKMGCKRAEKLCLQRNF